ncbi:MAG: hypothetical protein M0Z67_06170 [Nitrospiraceae bacterium]|nr:hypothetical protein [Nitrospiraceae bacterium]
MLKVAIQAAGFYCDSRKRRIIAWRSLKVWSGLSTFFKGASTMAVFQHTRPLLDIFLCNRAVQA